LREDPPELRQRPEPAVHEARLAFSWSGVARGLAIATLVSVFFSFLGAFGTSQVPFLTRTAIICLYGWVGFLIGYICFRLAIRLGFGRRSVWIAALASGVLMILPMGLFVAVAASIENGHPLPVSDWPSAIFQTGVMCVAMSFLAVAISHRRTVTVTAAQAAPPKFLDRLPLKLRGAEVWAVEAEDHYLRLHTSKGQDLILMRLADAVTELEGIEGAQVHRSWWVARDAIADAKRGDGRATLTLKDGSEVPVSRTYARLLRERSWI
jgi:hypothetical protein